MKIKQITAQYGKKYPYQPYLNESVGFSITYEPSTETELDDFTSLKEELKKRTSELKAISDEWHDNEMKAAREKAKQQKHNVPIDYEQSGVVVTKTKSDEHLATLPQKPAKPLSKEESIIADINTCTDVKTLEAYRLIAKSNKLLQDAYDIKMKSLKSKK